MSRLILFVAMCFSTTVLFAQDLLECLDPDVKAGLLFQGVMASQRVSRDTPDFVIDIDMRESLQFIGSAVSDFQTSVAYKTGLPAEEAMSEVVDALQNREWESFSNPGMQSRGFVREAQPVSAMLCRDDAMLAVSARPADGSSYVTVSRFDNRGGSACGTTVAGINRAGFGAARPVHEFMPRLTLPPEARIGRSQAGAMLAYGSGMSGDNRSANTNMQFESDLNAQGIVDYFSLQLEEQGWVLDGRWAARSSVGATWTSAPSDDVRLVGLMDVVSISDSTHEATFRLTRID